MNRPNPKTISPPMQIGTLRMRKAVLEFLRFERDQAVTELNQLERGEREIFRLLDNDRTNITEQAVIATAARVDRFEEIIARFEAGLG